MPPATSPGLPLLSREHERAARIRFRRAVALMLMTLVLPGSAQLAAGNRKVGRIALRIVLVVAALGLLMLLISLVWNGFALRFATSIMALGILRFGLIALALGWAVLFVDAWRLGQPLTLVKNQRLLMTGINGLLTFSVAGTLLFGAHMVGASRDFLIAVSGDGGEHAPSDGRFNVLLLGGDAGAGRWGLRPDSMTVASIDARTGRTVLVGLPRNMANFEFAEGSVMAEQFPDGFDCDGCYLNGVATWAADHKALFGDDKDPGITATVSAIEGITGLDIGYWALVDLKGFRKIVDAVGGVKLNVRDRIPIGLPSDDFYDHIEPGNRKLNGFETLWFARARNGSDDYSRMARQKCVMNALATQVDPQTVLRNFGEIAEAGGAMIRTNVPAGQMGALAQLALKAKSQKISTVSLVPPRVNTGNPDMDEIHAMVEKGIARSEGRGGKPAGKPSQAVESAPAANGETQRGGSLGTRDKGYVANEADDLSAAC